MTKVMNFSENLEGHLARLGHDVARLKEAPENKDLSERELVKRSLKSLVETRTESGAVKPANPSPAAPADDFLPSYLSGSSDENLKKSVERLLQMAVSGDIVKAVNEAKKYPPFVEDAFHDALVDKFLPELKKRGIIK